MHSSFTLAIADLNTVQKSLARLIFTHQTGTCNLNHLFVDNGGVNVVAVSVNSLLVQFPQPVRSPQHLARSLSYMYSGPTTIHRLHNISALFLEICTVLHVFFLEQISLSYGGLDIIAKKKKNHRPEIIKRV